MSAGAPVWVTVLTGFGSGTVGSGLGFWQARKLLPSTRRQIDAEASHSQSEAIHSAMQTVEEALNVARGRIDNLQQQVTTLTGHIGELREALRGATSEHDRIEEALNIALGERAKLQQQLMDINRRLGSRRLADLSLAPPDAIVMVDLASGEIVYANDGVYPLLGYVPSQVVGQPLALLIPDAVRERHTKLRVDYSHKPEQRAMGKGLPLFARPNGGGTLPVDISLHPTGDGRVIALIKRRADVTLDALEEAPPPKGDEPLTVGLAKH